MRDDLTISQWPIYKYKGDDWSDASDDIAAEYPLTLFVNGEEFATIVCSPTHLEEMTIGFLASEGAIRAYSDITDLSIDENRGFAYAEIAAKSALDPAFFSKRRIGSCCGKSRQSFYYYADAQTARPIQSAATITPARCYEWMNALHESSEAHRQTGGVHCAGLFGTDGLEAYFTDIGRHNALDKLYGHCLKQGISASDKAIAFSGRLSSEVVLKAVKIGASVLLSKSAPTDLGLRLADELGLTAVGFVRGSGMNVYTHPERINVTSYTG